MMTCFCSYLRPTPPPSSCVLTASHSLGLSKDLTPAILPSLLQCFSVHQTIPICPLLFPSICLWLLLLPPKPTRICTCVSFLSSSTLQLLPHFLAPCQSSALAPCSSSLLIQSNQCFSSITPYTPQKRTVLVRFTSGLDVVTSNGQISSLILIYVQHLIHLTISFPLKKSFFSWLLEYHLLWFSFSLTGFSWVSFVGLSSRGVPHGAALGLGLFSVSSLSGDFLPSIYRQPLIHISSPEFSLEHYAHTFNRLPYKFL